MSDDLCAALNQRIPGTMAGLLGIRLTEAEPGLVGGTMTARPELSQPYGLLHGGALMTFLDTLAGLGATLSLPPGKLFTTTEFKINFLRSVREGPISGQAQAIHLGGRTQVWQASAFDERGRQLALATLTQLIIEPRGE
jgi:uncharacterized protein (TIGR00369 family)